MEGSVGQQAEMSAGKRNARFAEVQNLQRQPLE